MKLNINCDAVVKFSNKLEKMHRSALPNAVRGALNKAAFDVKKRTMPAQATTNFVLRQSNFFKANSRVEMAKGWDLRQMRAIVGFTEQGLKGGNNYAVRDLEQQERGGTIKHRSFIPTDIARGGSNSKVVKKQNRLTNVNRIVNSNKGSNNRKQNFIKAVQQAGVGGHVIGNNRKKILWRIESISRVRGKLRIKKTPIYSFEDDRSVSVKGTHFMRNASLKSAALIESFYIEEAERQIEKLTK